MGAPNGSIRTLEEQLLWVRAFRTIEELRDVLHEFARTSTTQWIVERHGQRTPAHVGGEVRAEAAWGEIPDIVPVAARAPDGV